LPALHLVLSEYLHEMPTRPASNGRIDDFVID
jgi:hypothetical protein